MRFNHALPLLLLIALCLGGLWGCAPFRIPTPDLTSIPAVPIDHSGSAHPITGTFDTIGQWCLWGGIIAAVCGGVGLASGLIFAPLAAFAGLCEKLLIEGTIVALAGACLVWIGGHGWVLLVALAALGSLIVVRYRSSLVSGIRRMLRLDPPSPAMSISAKSQATPAPSGTINP